MSFGDIQAAINRQYLKNRNDIKISCLNDIKLVLSKLVQQKHTDSQPITIDINNVKLSAQTKSKSNKELLLEGMNNIKNKMEVQDRYQQNCGIKNPVFYHNKAFSNVDVHIENILGAKRDGLIIYWNIDGQRYEYDIFTDKLKRS